LTETHAYLPARKVVAACYKAKRAIDDARREVMRQAAHEMRLARPWLWLKPVPLIIASMPAPIHEIGRMHRAVEEATVDNILALAAAVTAEDETFQVIVSAGDFALLKDFYL
jgi:hypothetical protein